MGYPSQNADDCPQRRRLWMELSVIGSRDRGTAKVENPAGGYHYGRENDSKAEHTRDRGFQSFVGGRLHSDPPCQPTEDHFETECDDHDTENQLESGSPCFHQ